MKHAIFTITLLVSLVISLLPTLDKNWRWLNVASAQALLSGEVAYVLDGNIWLADVSTGNSRQLTNNGGNNQPSWSPDGRYLLYTHTVNEQQSLYIWNFESNSSKLLVDDACCAAWHPNSDLIAYITLSGLSVNTIKPNGSDPAIWFPSLMYARGSWAIGNMLWLPSSITTDGADQLLVPLEILMGSGTTGFTVVRDMVVIKQGVDSLLKAEIVLESGACGTRHIDISYSLSRAAVDYEQNSECTVQMTSPKGVVIYGDEFTKQDLPWMAYPTWSSDGNYLALERYEEANTPEDAKLWGLTIYDVSQKNEQDFIKGASQPAWRPTPAPVFEVMKYRHPNERIVSVKSLLTYQGATYQVHYLTASDYNLNDARFFYTLTSDTIVNQGITAILVTRDGQIVTDELTIEKVLLLFTSAYYLYENRTDVPAERIPDYGEELKKILSNPLINTMELEQRLRSRGAQTSEVLRTLMIDQLSPDAKADILINELMQKQPTHIEDALSAISTLIEDKIRYDKSLQQLTDELAFAYQDIESSAKWAENTSKLMRFVLKLLYISHLQEERAKLLTTYIDSFIGGQGSLDQVQLRSAASVLGEVEKSSTQRKNIAKIFVKDVAVDKVLDLTGEYARQLIAKIGMESGNQIFANTLASTLSAVSIGLTVNSIMYGTDSLYENYKLAEQAEELRAIFHSGRQEAYSRVDSDTNMQSELTYNGELVEAFRAAYLLEMFAAVQTQRFYADGVAATFTIPNPLQLLNWLRGQDWKVEVQELNRMADEIEIEAQNSLGNPGYIRKAIQLTTIRIQTSNVAHSPEQTSTTITSTMGVSPTIAVTPLSTAKNFGIEANGWRMIPVDTVEQEMGDGRKLFVLRFAAEKIGDENNSQTRDWCMPHCDVQSFTLLSNEGYTYQGGLVSNVPVSLPVAYGRATELNWGPREWWLPPGFIIQGNVIGIGWLQLYGLGFAPASGTSGYVIQTPFGNVDPVPADVRFPTSLPDSNFLNHGDSFMIGDVKVTASQMKIGERGNPTEISVVWQFENENVGYGRNVVFQSYAIGSSGVHIDWESSAGAFMGPRQSYESEKTYYVPPGDTNIKIILTSFKYEGEGQLAPNSLTKDSHVIYNFSISPGIASSEVTTANSLQPTVGAQDEQAISDISVSILANNLNVRSGPGTTYERIGQVNTNDVLTIVGRNADSSWLQICCIAGQKGWIVNNRDFITISGSIENIETIDASNVSELHPEATQLSVSNNCSRNPGDTFAVAYQDHRQLLGCPISDSIWINTISEQAFQGGHLFWRKDTNVVYIIYDRQKNNVELFEGSWEKSIDEQQNRYWDWAQVGSPDPEGIGLTPPSGLYEPKSGFGWLWRTHLGGENGLLGWAIDKAYGFDNVAQVQEFESGIMFKGSDPKVYVLLDSGKFHAR